MYFEGNQIENCYKSSFNAKKLLFVKLIIYFRMLNHLIRVKRKNIRKAIDCLVEAFADEPMCNHIFSNVDKKKEALTAYIEYIVKYGMRYGQVYTTSEKFEGVAIWIPSYHSDFSNWKSIKSGGIKMVLKLGFKIIKKIEGMNDIIKTLRENLVKEPHWVLSPIGVAPEYQGKGFASKLIRPFLKYLDKQQISCFLETMTQENLALYERYGFDVVGEIKIPNTDLTNWGMLRKYKK